MTLKPRRDVRRVLVGRGDLRAIEAAWPDEPVELAAYEGRRWFLMSWPAFSLFGGSIDFVDAVPAGQ